MKSESGKINKIVYSCIALLMVCVFVEAFYLFKDSPKPKDELNALWSGNYTKERQVWENRIEEVGAQKTYEEFKLDVAKEGFGKAHTFAHIMGELIYEKEGIKGVAVCDSSFSFGCYHSFFGKAISENGIGVIHELDQACIEKWGQKGLGCPHGIGHGIQGYNGDDKLVDSLVLCRKLSWQEPIGGCTSGVFMEFNFHTMESLTGAENRTFDPTDPHYPCNVVPKEFGQACYFEQPQWWTQVIGKEYATIGLMCLEAKSREEREACFRGLGNTIGPASLYDAASTLASCALMPEKETQMLCRQGASWAFYAEPSARDKAEGLCRDLDKENRRKCVAGFDLAGDRS